MSAYTARVLPARLTTAQRTRAALRALLAHRPGRRGTTPAVTGIIDPIAFTLQSRISPARRMREEWQQSDYARKLEQRIIAPRLQQCAT